MKRDVIVITDLTSQVQVSAFSVHELQTCLKLLGLNMRGNKGHLRSRLLDLLSSGTSDRIKEAQQVIGRLYFYAVSFQPADGQGATPSNLRCYCTVPPASSVDVIQCTVCGICQHTQCVALTRGARPAGWMCDMCRACRADPFWYACMLVVHTYPVYVCV